VILPPLPLVASLKALAVLLVLLAALVRLCFPPVYRSSRCRRAAAALAAFALMAHAAWAVGQANYPLSALGATVAVLLLPCLVFGIASVPLAALVHRLAQATTGLSKLHAISVPASAPAAAVTRRQLVQAITVAVPLVAVSTGASGFLSDRQPTALRPLTLDWAELPPALDGLRILQLSDLHLGCTKGLMDLENLLGRLSASPPDLIVLTGDVAEDVSLLPPALRMIADARPRLGAYASLGNHEYLNGITPVRRAYDRGPVPLLVSAGHTLDVGGASLRISAADDPVTSSRDIQRFMRASIDQALDGAPSDAFHLLLSHRPEGFDAAARREVHLTLSGHTHGGQIGFNGKSAFQPLYPDGYLWGSYARASSRLYTTSGFGDWYPFRLGCPTEAPVLTLRSAVTPPRWRSGNGA
jgi:predicted MPP superfamily phosphohydrolase